MKPNFIKIITGFLVLFLIYHAAEYMIVFRNSAAGFLGFQVLFFIVAGLIAKLQGGKGIREWGMGISKSLPLHLITGMLMGIVLYGSVWLISILTGSEKIDTIPPFSEMAMPLGLFVFGNFFSSFSEDILTRGYIRRHFVNRLSPLILILFSALVYLFNHIYRLNDGWITWFYLFSLGILYMVPLMLTEKLWYTGGMHWAGNCFFYFSHELINNKSVESGFNPNIILGVMALLLIPVNYLLIKRLGLRKQKTTGFPVSF